MRGFFKKSGLASFDAPIREAFRRREFDAWFQSARVMLGEEAVRDDFGEMMFETSEECREALEDYDVELPFLQVFNSHRVDPAVEALVKCPRLAEAAALLLGVPRVRLYQDSMFLKRPGDGPTRWHSDLHMAPFDTNRMVTAWIPLDHVPPQAFGGTGLTFASGSHRDFALAFWSRPHESGQDFSARYAECLADHGELFVGDVTWHHGWTLHSAPANEVDFDDFDDFVELEDDEDEGGGLGGLGGGPAIGSRLALTVSFIADGARVLNRRAEGEAEGVGDGVGEGGGVGLGAVVAVDDEDTASYESWLQDLEPGAVADHPLLPLVWEQTEQTEQAQ